MRRPIRWGLAALGVVLLVGGGASIFFQPADEVAYGRSGPVGRCAGGRCIALYTLEIGNTGSNRQPDVRVRLRGPLIDSAPWSPRVRDYGKVDRPVVVSREGDAVVYALGALEPEARVELTLVLQRPTREALPAWDDLLLAVEPARGRAVPGRPGWVVLLRLWYRLAGASRGA